MIYIIIIKKLKLPLKAGKCNVWNNINDKLPQNNEYIKQIFADEIKSLTAKIVQLVRTLISCINNENSSFSLGLSIYNFCCLLSIVTIISFLLLTKIPK